MPAAPNIPPPVAAFIHQHIHSVLQLEMLLWLKERGGEWTPAAIATELRITEEGAEIRLRDLVLRDLVVENPETRAFSYGPSGAEVHEVVEALERCYAETRYSVINLIFSSPGDSARSLAEAFRFRRKKDE